MPNLQTHCKISKKRTRESFEELHKWIDEATAYLSHNHRIERHFFTQEYKDFIEKKWGKKAVVEWLFHIALDNLETANKFTVNTYNTAFGEIEISFEGREISGCRFSKIHPNSKSNFYIELKKKIEKQKKNLQEKGIDIDFNEKLLLAQQYMCAGFDDGEAYQLTGIY